MREKRFGIKLIEQAKCGVVSLSQRQKFRKTTKPVLFVAGDKGRNTKDTQ